MRNKYYYVFLLSVMISIQAFAQQNVSGTIKSASGEAVIGASVLIRGTSNGTTTDINGAFALSMPAPLSDTATLYVSSVGYVSQSIPVHGQTVINFILKEDVATLQEVVVTGYQSQIKGNITGAVAIVGPELLNRIPVAGIDQALQGRVPGVVVTQNTGAPGEGVRVRIRGIGSINSNNTPLFVIDGLPTLDATAIAPQDIASMSVLKDASEAALYGSRAANGVVIVTTKLGAMNKPVITYNTQFGTQAPTRLIPMANTTDYVNLFNEAITNDGTSASKKITDDPSTLPNVNWVKAIMRPSPIVQTHSLTFSGGEGKTRYLVAGSYFSQDGIVKASDYKRLTLRTNVESQLKDWLRTGVNLNISSATTDLIGSSGDGAGGNGGSVLRYAYFRPSALPIYQADGVTFVDKPGDYYTSAPTKSQEYFGDGYNPVGMLAYNNNRKTQDRLFGKVFFILTPFKGFRFTSNSGLDYSSITQRRFDRNWGTENTPGHPRINDPNNLSVLNERVRNLTFTNFAEYEHSFGIHNFKFLLGTEAIKNQDYATTSTDKGFVDQSSALVYLGNGLGAKTVAESKTGNALLSFYGKVNYDLNKKYFASATIRRDGSSRFGLNNRWGNFYAASAGWAIDQDFLKDVSWVNRLFLRAGFGVIGNQEIPVNYPNQNLLASNFNYPLGGAKSTGFAINSFGNRDVKWETSKQVNVGVDWEIFDGRFSMSLDVFRKITSDLLVSQLLPSSLGFLAQAGSPYVNNGTINNSGIELGLTYNNSIGKFHYSISPNAGYLHNEVTSVTIPVPDGKIGSQFITQTQTGHPVGSFYLIKQDGIFQDATDVFVSAKPPQQTPTVGDVKYIDQNNDHVIDSKDRVFAGSAIPKITGGLNIQLNYGPFDLSAFFQGAYGQKIFSVLNVDIEGFYRPFNVTQRFVDEHWTPEHPSNKFPRASFLSSTNNTIYSTRFLENGSYTRLKNVQLGYTLPAEWLTKYHFSKARIYFSGTNLFTWTKYSGMDPEMTSSDNANGSGDRANGMDWGTYPAAKSYNLGLSLTF